MIPSSPQSSIERTLAVVMLLCAFGAAAMVIVSLFSPSGATSRLAGATVLVERDNGHGSGVHLGNGLVLTAAHVVDGASSVRLRLDNGDDVGATVLWSSKEYDIALLDTSQAPRAATAKLNCAATRVGQPIQAAGNPGNLRFLRTSGTIAAVEAPLQPWKYAVAIDATVVTGMSGGPAFNAAGEIVGIMVAVQSVQTSPFSAAFTRFGIMVPSTAICRLLGRTT